MSASKHYVSSVRPMEDETLISFLQRAQAAGNHSDHGFQSLVAGAPWLDAWRAERRAFDWDSLSRFVCATPDELYRMSQRSLVYAADDPSNDGGLRRWAPWLGVKGYAAHCPCCLKESAHWRKAWLNPSAIVCERHGTVLIRTCDQCGVALDEQTWTQVRPICPSCHNHLSLSPAVRASDVLIDQAGELQSQWNSLAARLPLSRGDYALARFGAIWRAAELIGSDHHQFAGICDEVLEMRGIERTLDGGPAVSAAMRHLENLIVAHLLAEMEPAFAQHFWLTVTNRPTLKRADEVLRGKISEIAESLSVTGCHAPSGPHQTTISFANWDESNGIRSAA